VKDFLLNKKIILLSNIALALLWGSFLWRHIVSYDDQGQTLILLFILVESILVVIFLFRKKPTDISVKIPDWVAALAGTFAPLLFIPENSGLFLPSANTLLVTGTIIVFLAYLSLNTSLGIVPADRGVKITGLYRIVRHPMYLGYIVLDTGYLLLNASPYNLLIFIIIICAIIWRIRAEEAFLEHANADYSKLKKQTPFALIPFVY